MLKHPLLALAVGLSALALRLAVPAGYMPIISQSGVALMICSGPGPVVVSAPSHHSDLSTPGAHHEERTPKADSGCAFADLSLPMIGGVDAVQLAAALIFILAAGLTSLAVLPPRAALRLRPPLRGPPLPA